MAVGVGLTLAALLYIYRVAETTTVSPVTEDYIRDGLPHILQGRIIPPYVTLLRIHGPFLFGTTEKLVEATAKLEAFPARGDSAPAQHDGDRRHRHSRDRDVRQAAARRAGL